MTRLNTTPHDVIRADCFQKMKVTWQSAAIGQQNLSNVRS